MKIWLFNCGVGDYESMIIILFQVAHIDFSVIKSIQSETNIYGMNMLKKLVRDANFTTGDRFATVWGKPFANWVTDEVG